MSTITTKDGAEIYYKDWGKGPVVTFSHGWPLNADAWDGQMLFLVQHGYRCVALDRRGHGRSSQPSAHNDMDGYADDLAAVIEALDLKDAVLVGHSTGGGEVARYIGRHGTSRVKKAVLVAAVPPIMLQTAANPEGLPMEVFDAIRAGVAGDRSQYYKDLAIAFYGANRPGANVSQGILDQFWLWSMQAGTKNAYESIKAFSETDFTEDLKKFDVPTLVLHGEDDQIVPVKDSAKKVSSSHQGRARDLLSGRAARPDRHASGSGQRRSARLHPWVGIRTARRMGDLHWRHPSAFPQNRRGRHDLFTSTVDVAARLLSLLHCRRDLCRGQGLADAEASLRRGPRHRQPDQGQRRCFTHRHA